MLVRSFDRNAQGESICEQAPQSPARSDGVWWSWLARSLAKVRMLIRWYVIRGNRNIRPRAVRLAGLEDEIVAIHAQKSKLFCCGYSPPQPRLSLQPRYVIVERAAFGWLGRRGLAPVLGERPTV